MTDIINDIAEKIAERMDVEIAREFITTGVKMLYEDGIRLDMDQTMTSMRLTDNQLSCETTIKFSGVDASEHDKRVIDAYKDRVSKEISARLSVLHFDNGCCHCPLIDECKKTDNYEEKLCQDIWREWLTEETND